MLEFDLGGQHYRAGKLNAFQQLHLSRKLAPLLPKLLPAFAPFVGREQEDSFDLSAFSSAVGPLAEALANMSDADAEYIFGVCLTVVSRQQGNSWAPIWNTAAKSPMFEDLELPELVEIVVKVAADNLGPFMRGLRAQAQANSPAVAQ